MNENNQDMQGKIKTHAHLFGLCLGNKLLEAHVLIYDGKAGKYDLKEYPSCQMPAMAAITKAGEILVGFRARNFWYSHKDAPVFYGESLYTEESFDYKGIRFTMEDLCVKLFLEFSRYLDSFLGEGYKECYAAMFCPEKYNGNHQMELRLRSAGFRPQGIASGIQMALCTNAARELRKNSLQNQLAIGYTIDHQKLLLTYMKFAGGIAEEIAAKEISDEIADEIFHEVSDEKSAEAFLNLPEERKTAETCLNLPEERKTAETCLNLPEEERKAAEAFLHLPEAERKAKLLHKYSQYIPMGETQPVIIHFKDYERYAARGALYRLMQTCGLKDNFPVLETEADTASESRLSEDAISSSYEKISRYWNAKDFFSYLYQMTDIVSQKFGLLTPEEREKPLAIGIMKVLKACGELMKEPGKNWQNPESDRLSSYIINKILDIYDGIESGIRAIPDDAGDEVTKILTSIFASYQNALIQSGIEQVPSEGKKFDPNQHYAIMKEASTVIKDGYILDEYQKGFRYRGQLIRASKVKVSID